MWWMWLLACGGAETMLGGLSEADKVAVEARRAEAMAIVEAHDAARRKGLADLSNLVPKPELGPCPVTLQLPTQAGPSQGFDLERMERQLRMLQRIDLDFKKPDEVAQMSGPLVVATTNLLTSKPMDLASFEAEATELTSADHWDVDAVIVQDLKISADKDKAQAGVFVGRAVVWSYAEKQVLCMADVEVVQTEVAYEVLSMNGKPTGDTFQLAAGVQLSEAVFAQGLNSLVRVGPRDAAQP